MVDNAQNDIDHDDDCNDDLSDQEEGCKKQSTGTTVDMEVNLKMVSIREKRLLKMIMIVVNDDYDKESANGYDSF